MIELFSIFGIGVVLTLIVGFYCILASDNLIRALIGVEILSKGATLLIIVAGYVTGRTALAQALAITMIIVEVAVIATAVGVVLCAFRHTGSIHASSLRNVKG